MIDRAFDIWCFDSHRVPWVEITETIYELKDHDLARNIRLIHHSVDYISVFNNHLYAKGAYRDNTDASFSALLRSYWPKANSHNISLIVNTSSKMDLLEQSKTCESRLLTNQYITYYNMLRRNENILRYGSTHVSSVKEMLVGSLKVV